YSTSRLCMRKRLSALHTASGTSRTAQTSTFRISNDFCDLMLRSPTTRQSFAAVPRGGAHYLHQSFLNCRSPYPQSTNSVVSPPSSITLRHFGHEITGGGYSCTPCRSICSRRCSVIPTRRRIQSSSVQSPG